MAECPHCHEPLSLELVADATKDQRVVFRFSPQPGSLLSARNLGGAIEQTGRLLISCAKDAGFRAQVMVEKIETDADGQVSVHLLVAHLKSARAA